MNFVKLIIALIIIAAGASLALSMAAESYANAGGELRVFSPSAEAVGDTAVAIVGNRNHVAIGQAEPPAQPGPSALQEIAAWFFGTIGVGAVLVTIALLAYANNPAEKSPPKDWTL